MKNFILICILVFPLLIFSQEEYSTKNKRAIKHFEAALVYYEKYEDLNTITQLKMALDIDSNFVEAYNLFATLYENKKDFLNTIKYYSKSIKANPDFSYKTYYLLGKAQLRMGIYEDAKDNFESCINFEGVSPRFEAYSTALLERAEFGINAVNKPIEFNPVNMGENVNTEYDDYWPSLTIDEKVLTTTVRLPKDDRFPISQRNSQEDFLVTYKIDSSWTKAVNIGPPINTEDNEGSQAFSVDGRLLFYAVCNRKEDYGSCDIYFSEKKGNVWSNPKNIGQPVNSIVWESNPTFSSDGRTLIFTVDHRRGGSGKKDLWKSVLQYGGTWSEPENLGDLINSDGNDIAPFIHPDNKTLYFASDGHLGMGGMDLFVSRKDTHGVWQKPVNLGYPINTFQDEFGLIVNAHGNLAMFSSDREDSRGQDIYSFKLPVEFRPNPVTYVKGIVYDVITNKKLGAKFELIDLETSEIVVRSFSNEVSGEYIVCLPIDRNYAFNVSKENYLFHSENFSLKNIDDPTKPYKLDIPLQPLAKGVKVVLKNIFFETDSYKLKPESYIELRKLIEFMNFNLNLKVEIGGHTDNVGTKQYNQTLSNNRARTVYDYLIKNNISSSRLSYKAYYFSQPIYSNDTEEGRAMNRRTEFKIVEVE